MHALRVQLSNVASNPVHAVLLQGVGSHFCTGGAQHQDAGMLLVAPQLAPMTSAVADMVDCVMTLTQIALPVLASLHGKLIGGGVALALNTDWRSCTVNTMFCQGNLPRNMNPITNFSRTLGQCAGTTTAHALHLEDTTISGMQACTLDIVQVLDADATAARRSAHSVGKHLMGILPQLRTTRDDVFLSTEDALNACVGRQNITLASHGPRHALHSKGRQPVQTGSYRLVGDQKLCFLAVPIEPPITIPTGHVLVQMSAYGLNFRYVYPFDASSMQSKCVCLFAARCCTCLAWYQCRMGLLGLRVQGLSLV